MLKIFHVHNFVEIARTYAPPTQMTHMKIRNYDTDNDGMIAFESMVHGCITFVFKCQGVTCCALKKIVALGQIVEKGIK